MSFNETPLQFGRITHSNIADLVQALNAFDQNHYDLSVPTEIRCYGRFSLFPHANRSVHPSTILQGHLRIELKNYTANRVKDLTIPFQKAVEILTFGYGPEPAPTMSGRVWIEINEKWAVKKDEHYKHRRNARVDLMNQQYYAKLEPF